MREMHGSACTAGTLPSVPPSKGEEKGVNQPCKGRTDSLANKLNGSSRPVRKFQSNGTYQLDIKNNRPVSKPGKLSTFAKGFWKDDEARKLKIAVKPSWVKPIPKPMIARPLYQERKAKPVFSSTKTSQVLEGKAKNPPLIASTVKPKLTPKNNSIVAVSPPTPVPAPIPSTILDNHDDDLVFHIPSDFLEDQSWTDLSPQAEADLPLEGIQPREDDLEWIERIASGVENHDIETDDTDFVLSALEKAPTLLPIVPERTPRAPGTSSNDMTIRGDKSSKFSYAYQSPMTDDPSDLPRFDWRRRASSRIRSTEYAPLAPAFYKRKQAPLVKLAQNDEWHVSLVAYRQK